MNRSWGGHLETVAISELYKVGIVVWELSRAGELVTPLDNTQLASSKGLNIYLSRHRGVHFNSVIFKNKPVPLNSTKALSLESWIRYVRGSLIDSLSITKGGNEFSSSQLMRSDHSEALSSSPLRNICAGAKGPSNKTAGVDGISFESAALADSEESRAELSGLNIFSGVTRAEMRTAPWPKESFSNNESTTVPQHLTFPLQSNHR